MAVISQMPSIDEGAREELERLESELINEINIIKSNTCDDLRWFLMGITPDGAVAPNVCINKRTEE